MSSVDQPLQAFGAAIRVLWCEGKYAVISPVAGAGELSDGHQLKGGNSQTCQFRETRDQGLERSFRRICPHVKFVENARFQRYPVPRRIGPLKPSHVYEMRRAVHSLGLKSRCGIRQFARILQPVQIWGSGLQTIDCEMVISPLHRLPPQREFVRAQKIKALPTRAWSPQYKLPRPVRNRGRTKASFFQRRVSRCHDGEKKFRVDVLGWSGP